MDFPAIFEHLRGIFNLLIILSILVVAHEWGHYIAAKYFKMRVEEFALFFGKVLIRLGKRGDTEYNIRAIPAGGFVRIAGMEADDISGGRPILEAIRNPQFHGEDAIEKVIKELDEETMAGIDASKISPEFRETLQQSIGPDGKLTESGLSDLQALKRSPRINTDEHKLLDLALQAHTRANDPGLYSQKPIYQRALVIFAGPLASLAFGYLIFCVMGMTIGLQGDKATNQIALMPDSPAQKAGLKSGDKIIEVNGIPTPDGKTMIAQIRPNPDRQITLTIQRGPSTFPVKVTPKGEKDKDPETNKEVVIGRIGVMPSFELQRLGVGESIVRGTQITVTYVQRIIMSIFSRDFRKNIGGPIAMGQIATQNQRFGVFGLVQMAGMFSISLGIMNLLPIPILDGGHLLLLGVEKLRRRKLSPREVYRAQMVGLGLLALLLTFVMYNDIARIISGRSF